MKIVPLLRNINRTALAAAVFVTACGAVVTTADAQTICGKRADFLKHLDRNFQEHIAYMALTKTSKVLEVLTSEAGTWTILLTDSHGLTCLVSAGEAWEALQAQPGEPS